MIERQFFCRAAILTAEPVPQEEIKPGKGRLFVLLDVAFEADNAGEAHLEAGRPNNAVIFRNNIHPLKKDRFERILPGPQRQRKIAEGPVIGV